MTQFRQEGIQRQVVKEGIRLNVGLMAYKATWTVCEYETPKIQLIHRK